MEIYKTKKYGQFKSFTSNREVDPAHVKRLAKSIERKNLMHIRPVICTPSLHIIDGQHRVAACERVGADVFYIEVDNLTKDDIAILNTAQKNWSSLDFINFFAVEGHEHYLRFARLINKYPMLKFSTIRLFCVDRGRRLREGKLQLQDYDKADETCRQLSALWNRMYLFVAEVKFGAAFISVVKTPDDFMRLVERIDGAGGKESFVKRESEADYRSMLKSLTK